MPFRAIYSDYRRYRATGRDQGSAASAILLTQGFWASSVYRVAHHVQRTVTVPILRPLLCGLMLIIQKAIEVLTGMCLPAECEIDRGLYIGHFGHLIVHPRARIGANCNLGQGVTIGAVQRGDRTGVPVIANGVYVGPNAVIIGGIEIGADAAIGAGAIVIHSIPPRGVVAGNPARLVSYDGSFEFICYDGMEMDPERMAALEQREQQ
jgi:serine O-acetyltransferase